MANRCLRSYISIKVQNSVSLDYTDSFPDLPDFFLHESDYEYSLWGLSEGRTEYSKMKHEVHLSSAHKLQDLCFRNGGIYIKLSQHISQLVCLILSSVDDRNQTEISTCDRLVGLA